MHIATSESEVAKPAVAVMLKCLLKYHFGLVRLFHVASGSSHKSYKGGAITVKTRQQESVRVGARKEETISVEVRKEVAWGSC